MAKFVYTDFVVTVATVDLSAYATSVEVDETYPEVDLTGGGDDYAQTGLGIPKLTVTINWLEDYASSKVYATLAAAKGTSAAVTCKPTSGTVSATNPEFQLTCMVSQRKLMAGQLNSAASFSTTWPANALTVDVTP